MVTDGIWNRVLKRRYMPQDPMVSIAWSISDKRDLYADMGQGGRVAMFSGVSHLDTIDLIAQDMNRLFEDIKACRPSYIGAAPRFWNIVYQEYQNLLRAAVS